MFDSPLGKNREKFTKKWKNGFWAPFEPNYSFENSTKENNAKKNNHGINIIFCGSLTLSLTRIPFWQKKNSN